MLLFLYTLLYSGAGVAEVSSANHSENCTWLTSCLGDAVNTTNISEHFNIVDGLWLGAINSTNEVNTKVNHSSVVTTSSRGAYLQDVVSDSKDLPQAASLLDTLHLVWRIVPGLDVRLVKKEKMLRVSLVKDEGSQREGRTFGIGKRRIMMTLLPIMYKMGVITTLLIVLTVITLKGLTVGVILLTLSLAKLKVGEGDHQKEVHFHVHPFSKTKYPWGRVGEESSEVTSTTPPFGYLPPFWQ